MTTLARKLLTAAELVGVMLFLLYITTIREMLGPLTKHLIWYFIGILVGLVLGMGIEEERRENEQKKKKGKS